MTPPAGQNIDTPDPPQIDWGMSAINKLSLATQTYLSGMSAYATEFFVPFLLSSFYFNQVESERIFNSSPIDTFSSYLNLLDFNLDLANRSFTSTLDILNAYGQSETEKFFSALNKFINNNDCRDFDQYASDQLNQMNNLVYGYPKAIGDIEPEFGFHFEKKEHELVAETDRFYLYQVAPTEKNIKVRSNAKPILIIPPYVLGANILCFLPGEKRSYVHSFANKGFPTYIRILKNIETAEALQTMTAEDDTRDTRYFCETLLKRNGKPVTLNGYCQGGYNALCNILSGELDGLVDAFISCVAPMDGTKSTGLANFLKRLPKRFNDLAYGTKTLPNGNKVADGRLMGWVYRLKSIATEQPLAAFYNNLMLVSSSKKPGGKFTKVAAALNYWLINERSDLPLEITKISFASYNTPITKDGVLPIKLFGRKLELKRINDKKIPWLICYGVHDNLVEPKTALAPLDHVDAEVTPFPKGHVAIATSWSTPNSACSLDGRFGDKNYRGPVLFHMDMDLALDGKKDKTEISAHTSSQQSEETLMESVATKPTEEPFDKSEKKPSAPKKGAGPDVPSKAKKEAGATASKAKKAKKSSSKKTLSTASITPQKDAKGITKRKTLSTKATQKSQTKTINEKKSGSLPKKTTASKSSKKTIKS